MGKTDNGDLRAKLELRRYFMRKYHSDGSARVFDCCQGSGLLWRVLRQEFPLANYWGVDLKAKPGRLKIDSARILAQPGWTEDVIDVDTYGAPWDHWGAILANLTHSATVFLTVGQWQMAVHRAVYRALGTGSLKIPPGIGVKLQGISLSYLLTTGCGDALMLKDAREAISHGNARYLGVRLEPKPSAVAAVPQ